MTTSLLPSGGGGLRGTRRGRMADPAFRWSVTGAGVTVLVILAWMIVSTTAEAWPIFAREGANFFLGTEWSPGSGRSEIRGTYGGFAFLFGTVVSSIIAMAISVPLAVGIALYLTQLAPKRIKQPLTYLVDLLAAVPSIVYGLWGSLFLVPILIPAMNWVADTLGFIPWLEPPVRVRNLFVASLVLAIMILPITSAVVREVFAQVPKDERFAAYGLGATRWEVMRHVVLPRSRAGIIGGSMLGFGRALGETIAVLLIIGGTARTEVRFFDTSQTVAAHIASAFREAAPEHIRALLALGVALFLITILVNVAARIIVSRLGNVSGDAAL